MEAGGSSAYIKSTGLRSGIYTSRYYEASETSYGDKMTNYPPPSYRFTLWVLILGIAAAFGMMVLTSLERW